MHFGLSKFITESMMCLYTSIANNFENGLECLKNTGVLAIT